MKVLVNSIGIVDSGGIKVLEKFLCECMRNGYKNKFIILITSSPLVDVLIEKYRDYIIFSFKILKFNGYIHRLCYENLSIKKLVKENDIDLVYNFTGTAQFFLKCPQLVKIHNLLYYSKTLDSRYKKNLDFILWLRQVLLKRMVFKSMLNKSDHIEIQSKHVKDCLSDYINIKSKHIHIKSDVDVTDGVIHEPKKYNFNEKVKFLYIVGPHFDSRHKNFIDFTNGMVELNKLSIDFELNITLRKDQLLRSKLWNNTLNSKTNFHGYISDTKKMKTLFSDNTILVSTSIIETLGLHVIEAIKNGIVTITPNEAYADDVYGTQRYSYDLFNAHSLSDAVSNIINDNEIINSKILEQQKYIKLNESYKLNNVVDVLKEVLNVYR